jgi:lipopolysaccharide biosynthesis glycosyltransferase
MAFMKDNLLQDSIHIVCCSDEQYMPLTATMLMSLVRNHTSHELLNVYIINNGVSQATQHNIDNLFSSENIVINWLPVDPKQIPSILEISDQYENISCHYYRLLTPYLLSQKITKVLYLDVDLVILKDISELWKIDFNNHIVAATQDFLESCGNAISNCIELGIDPRAKYFNSGVLLIDLKKWREQDISKKVIRCRLSNEEAVRASSHYSYDQFGLNIILVNQWHVLAPQWNYSPGPEKSDISPSIVHYYGDVKPWKPKCKEEFRQHFVHYLNQTFYGDYFNEEFKALSIESYRPLSICP